MRKLFTILLVLVFAVAASAQNPHLVGPVKYNSPGNPIFITGKIAGLGSNTMIYLKAEADVFGDSYCITKGSGQRTASLTFNFDWESPTMQYQSGKNGSVTFKFEISNFVYPFSTWEGVTYDCHGTQKRVVMYSITSPVAVWWSWDNVSWTRIN